MKKSAGLASEKEVLIRTDPHASPPVSSLMTLRTSDPVSTAVLSAQMVKSRVSVSPDASNGTESPRVR